MAGVGQGAGGIAVRNAPPLREEVVRPQQTKKEGGVRTLPLSTYSASWVLRQDPGRAITNQDRIVLRCMNNTEKPGGAHQQEDKQESH